MFRRLFEGCSFVAGGREFAAETISIFVVQLIMGFIAQKTTHRVIDALVVLSLYPLSLVLVIVLEQIGLN